MRPRRSSGLDGLVGVEAVLRGLPGDVDLEQRRLAAAGGERLGDPQRVDRLDEREAAGGEPDLVGLQVADQVPLGARHRVHLPERLLHAVLAQHPESGLHRLPAGLRRPALGDRHDGHLVGIAPAALDPPPDRGEALGDA
jgi:hypothetical protein